MILGYQFDFALHAEWDNTHVEQAQIAAYMQRVAADLDPFSHGMWAICSLRAELTYANRLYDRHRQAVEALPIVRLIDVGSLPVVGHSMAAYSKFAPSLSEGGRCLRTGRGQRLISSRRRLKLITELAKAGRDGNRMVLGSAQLPCGSHRSSLPAVTKICRNREGNRFS
ncbi:MAG TPA: hypothetical protein VJM09_09230 [Sphingobium sp.]|nr:hypothetical protein [Sphingobium sp.]